MSLRPIPFFTTLALWLALVLPVAGWAQTPKPALFVMGVDESGTPEDSYTGRLVPRIYNELFRRLQVPLEFVRYPAARLSMQIEHGAVDGEIARAAGYADSHPDLVRVQESVLDAVFALYVDGNRVNLRQLNELSITGWRVAYRTGVLYCENTLRRLVTPDRLTTVSTPQQGLQLLQRNRVDLYCDVDLAVVNHLYGPEFRDSRSLRKLLDASDPAPLYPYFLAKHADLAVRAATVLKQMKREGLLQRYDQEVLREIRP